MAGKSFQFSLSSLLTLVTAFAVLFSVFRWAELSLWSSLLLTSLFIVSLVGGFALILSMLHSLDDDE